MDELLQGELTRLGKLIDLIYQAATDMAAWQKVPYEIGEWIGTVACLVLTPLHAPEQGGFAVMHNVAPQAWELWTSKYLPHDLWAQRAHERGLTFTGCVARDQDLVAEEEFLESILYQELLEPLGWGRFLNGIIFSASENRHLPVVCACHRSFDNPFSEPDAEKMRILLPHLSRALGVMFRLRDAEFKVATSLATLDRLPSGVLLFDLSGKVAFANQAANRILKQEDGLRLRNVTAGRDKAELIAGGADNQDALNEAIREAISPDILSARHFARAVSISRPSGKPSYTLNFSTLPASNEFGMGAQVPRAIAFLTDSAAEIRLDAALLKSAYRLTDAEIRLAGQMVNGESVEEAAQSLGVSTNTVKTQLGQIYDKTNTRNRAKLVKLLMTLAAGG